MPHENITEVSAPTHEKENAKQSKANYIKMYMSVGNATIPLIY